MRETRRSKFPFPLIALAPMSEWNDLAFISLAREYGADLVFMGLISSEGLARKSLKTKSLLRYPEKARPVFAQIFGSCPRSMEEAAKLVEEEGFDGIDINAGCPVPKVMRTGSGAALMEDLKNARHVVKSVRKAVKIPVTIKMRLGPTGIEHIKLAKIAEEEGLDAVILHPRTPRQGYSGKADWEKIAELKATLSIPVLASGDVIDGASFLEVLRTTECDGVLIGRGALGNPWIFQECRYALAGKEYHKVEPEEKEQAMLKFIAYIEEFYGEKGMKFAKRHLSCFLKGLPGASRFRSELQRAGWPQLKELVGKFFEELRSAK